MPIPPAPILPDTHRSPVKESIASFKQIEYLAGISPEEAEEIAQSSEMKTYPDGALVIQQGERLPGVFIVTKGTLKVLRTDGRGKAQVLNMLKPGSCIGEVEVFDGGPSASSAMAYRETEICFIPAASIHQLVCRNPKVAQTVIRSFARKVRRFIALVETLSLHSVPERAAQIILERHAQNPSRALVEFPETQEDLAQCIGASREAFSRSLRLLSDLGLIQSTFPVIHIRDLAKLRQYANTNLGITACQDEALDYGALGDQRISPR